MLSGIRIYWRAYLKRLIPDPYSHCRSWTLILCASNLDPRIHQCVARTKVMSTTILRYPHVLEYGCCHFVARLLDILFRVAVAFTPIILSTEATKGEKC